MNNLHGRIAGALIIVFFASTVFAGKTLSVQSQTDQNSAIPQEVQKTIQLRQQSKMLQIKQMLQPKQQLKNPENSRDSKISKQFRMRKERHQLAALRAQDHRRVKNSPELLITGSRRVTHSVPLRDITALNLLVNGQLADTVSIGAGAVLTFSFPAGVSSAALDIIVDVNENGMLDDADVYVDMEGSIMLDDNDFNDSNPADGEYELVMDQDFGDGMAFVQAGLFFEVSSGDEVEAVYLRQGELDTDYSISGMITDEMGNPLPGIIVIAEMENLQWAVIDVSDSTGMYEINLPDSGEVSLFSGDFLMQTGGMYPDPMGYESVYVNGHFAGFDFQYLMGNAVISGTVADNNMNPVPGVGVFLYLDWDMQEFYAVTDADGFYSVNVPAGWYEVQIAGETVIPEYMPGEGQEAEVNEFDSVTVDFTIYETNATITGNVSQDNMPAPGFPIQAWAPLYGWTKTITASDGTYELLVYDAPNDSMDYYWVYVDTWNMPNVIVEPSGYYAYPNTGGYDFTITPVTGGITGFLINWATNDTLFDNAWVWAEQIDGDYYQNTGLDWETGNYTLWLPPGSYEVGADADGYYSIRDTVQVGTELVSHDFHLSAIELTSDIHGYVYSVSVEDSLPIPDAWVEVYNDDFWADTYTDENGYYQIDLPSGEFDIWVGADNHWGAGDLFYVEPGEYLERDFYLTPSGGFSGGLEGYVFDSQDESPIMDAEVYVGNDEFWAMDNTGPDGYFNINAPPGNYWVDVGAPNYYSEYDSVGIGQEYVWRDYYLEWAGSNDYGEVSGIILDSLTNSPIPGVEVYLGSQDGSYANMTYSDENGEFYFGDVPYNWYSLLFEAEGYYNQFVLDFPVDEGNPTPYFSVYMSPGAFESAFWGHISDTEMNPVEYAAVAAYEVSGGSVVATLTDESGNYWLPVENGTYNLIVQKPGFGMWFSDIAYTLENDTVEVNVILQEGPSDGVPPQILGIMDVPNDQGKQVRIAFNPGQPNMDEDFIGWSIWRELELPTGSMWEFINYIPYHDMDPYVVVAPTLRDSNMYTGPANEYWTSFMVSGHTWDPYYYIDSPPDSGYSIDNIAPNVPTGVSGAREESGIAIVWDATDAPDLQYYTVYRGNTAGFNVNEATMVDHSAEPNYFDASDHGYPVYYRVTAIDINGNTSGHSNEIMITGTGTDSEYDLPSEYALQQNYPNPFNPTTTLRYGIPEAGTVNITVYNLLGQPVKTLINTQQEPGYYTISWDGADAFGQQVSSGMYLYKIQVMNGTDTRYQTVRKMMLMR